MNHENNCRNTNSKMHDCRHMGKRRGPSSFFKHDSVRVFEQLALKEGDAVLDLGCGAGDYSIFAAKQVGESGYVYALDLHQGMLDNVKKEAMAQGIINLYPVFSDIRDRIDLPDDLIDTCLLATVLHTMSLPSESKKLFGEVRRVLKPEGKLAVIECKKENTLHGPPLQMRISPQELEKALGENGFKKTAYIDLGFNYMMTFDLC